MRSTTICRRAGLCNGYRWAYTPEEFQGTLMIAERTRIRDSVWSDVVKRYAAAKALSAIRQMREHMANGEDVTW